MVPQNKIMLHFDVPFKVEIPPRKHSILFPQGVYYTGDFTITKIVVHPGGQTWWGSRGISKRVERVATPTHPLEKFLNLSGYPCLALLHTKKNIINCFMSFMHN